MFWLIPYGKKVYPKDKLVAIQSTANKSTATLSIYEIPPSKKY